MYWQECVSFHAAGCVSRGALTTLGYLRRIMTHWPWIDVQSIGTLSVRSTGWAKKRATLHFSKYLEKIIAWFFVLHTPRPVYTEHNTSIICEFTHFYRAMLRRVRCTYCFGVFPVCRLLHHGSTPKGTPRILAGTRVGYGKRIKRTVLFGEAKNRVKSLVVF